MQPPPAHYYASNSSSSPQKRSVIRETHLSNWSWENGHKKQRVGGQFQWIVANDKIDFNSVCQNYKRGSLVYRDCRKGAKVAFKQICSQYQPACAAENNSCRDICLQHLEKSPTRSTYSTSLLHGL